MSWFHSKLNASNGALGEKLSESPDRWVFEEITRVAHLAVRMDL